MYYTKQALENVKTTWNSEQKDSESQLVIGCWMIFICHVFRKLNNRHLYNIRLNGWEVSLCCMFCFYSSCVPYVASFSELFLFCFYSSCVPYVASFSELFLFCFYSSCLPYVASFSRLSLF